VAVSSAGISHILTAPFHLNIQIMREDPEAKLSEGVWFVYDGDCPICSLAAEALRIREAAGPLTLVNARQESDHPLYIEITDAGFDLDEGMVLRVGGRNYHGRDALNMMALLGSGHGWFNRMNALLFKSPQIAKVMYPSMRALRNLLISLKGVPPLQNVKHKRADEPIFAAVFGDSWASLPAVLKTHYAIRAHSSDKVVVQGKLDVKVQGWLKLMAHLTGFLVPYSGKDVPVTVTFKAGPDGKSMEFSRIFRFPGKFPVGFVSTMEVQENGEVVEFMRYGFGWRYACIWTGEHLSLVHCGYAIRVFGKLVPLPLSLLLGKGYAMETAISDESFSMWTHIDHPIFGKTLSYTGEFKVTEVSCGPS